MPLISRLVLLFKSFPISLIKNLIKNIINEIGNDLNSKTRRDINGITLLDAI